MCSLMLSWGAGLETVACGTLRVGKFWLPYGNSRNSTPINNNRTRGRCSVLDRVDTLSQMIRQDKFRGSLWKSRMVMRKIL